MQVDGVEDVPGEWTIDWPICVEFLENILNLEQKYCNLNLYMFACGLGFCQSFLLLLLLKLPEFQLYS